MLIRVLSNRDACFSPALRYAEGVSGDTSTLFHIAVNACWCCGISSTGPAEVQCNKDPVGATADGD